MPYGGITGNTIMQTHRQDTGKAQIKAGAVGRIQLPLGGGIPAVMPSRESQCTGHYLTVLVDPR